MDSTCWRLVVQRMFFGAVHSQSCAGMHFRWHRQRRHPGCVFPPSLKHRKSSETLFSTRLWKACRVTTRWRARPPFMIAWALVLAPLGVQSLLSCLGRPQQQGGDARWSMSFFNGIEKRDCHFSVGKMSSASRQIPFRYLDKFVSVGGPQSRSVVAEKKKAMSMNEWQLVGLSRYSFEGEVLVDLERTVRGSGH